MSNFILYSSGNRLLQESGSSFVWTWEPFSGDFNLFIAGGETSSGQLPLFIENSSGINNDLLLYISGGGHPINGQLPLFLYNEIFAEDFPLYVRGLGETDGAYPLNNDLNLFLCRDTYTYGSFDLFLKSFEEENNSLNLFIKGTYTINGSFNLVIPNVLGEINNELFDLYTHGF